MNHFGGKLRIGNQGPQGQRLVNGHQTQYKGEEHPPYRKPRRG